MELIKEISVDLILNETIKKRKARREKKKKGGDGVLPNATR